jgi:hypothetical protein
MERAELMCLPDSQRMIECFRVEGWGAPGGLAAGSARLSSSDPEEPCQACQCRRITLVIRVTAMPAGVRIGPGECNGLRADSDSEFSLFT